MDGLESTRAIRQLPEGRRVPIIAMTANAFEDDRQSCRAAGMNDFVAKPISLQALYAALDKWLSARGASVLTADGDDAAGVAVSAPVPQDPAQDHVTAQIMERLSREAGVGNHKGVNALNGRNGKLISLLRMMAATHRDD
ncbi:MAG: response regulator [Proteobacteria bacterium]|nr:response regulator [Pseudomonadota bacterium]